MERRIKLGELLIRAGLITELQLKAALAQQKQWGGRLGQILVQLNFISEDILVKGLAKLMKLPVADFDQVSVPPAVLSRFDPADCQSRAYLPLQYNGAEKTLLVAFADVNDLALIDDLRYRHSLTIRPALAGENTLQAAIRRVFYGETFDTTVRGDEPGLKLVNNQGGTLIKKRSEIEAQRRPAAASSPMATGVERAPAGLPQAQTPWAAPPPPPVAQPLAPPVQAVANDRMTQLIAQLEQSQKRQSQAVKTVLELLIAHGVFTRDEFLQAASK